MKQDAFIQQLRQELASLPKQAVDEIVADYREYIGDALAAGRSEEEVIAALGDPAKLARELKAQANYRQWERHRSFSNLMRVVTSIAGLGLLNVILLVPFMLYLVLLTAGYAASAGIAIAGLVTVLTLGSHQAFGWPNVDSLPMSFIGNGFNFDFDSDDAKKNGAKASVASNDDDDDDDDDKPASSTQAAGLPTELRDMKIVGDRFVFSLPDGSHLDIVTKSGVLSLRKHDNKLDINSTGDAGSLLTKQSDGSFSIARDAVKVLSLKDEDGTRVDVARDSSDPQKVFWDIHSDDGHVSFEQDEHGNPTRIAMNSGSDALVIDNHQLSIDSKHNHFHFKTAPGASWSGLALAYGFVALFGGIVGLLLCVWLTRATWRGLVRYVKSQIDLLTARLEGTPAP